VTGSVRPRFHFTRSRAWINGRASVQTRDGVLTIETGRRRWTMPCGEGPVRVLVDGPIVEIFGPEGVAAWAAEERR
jgi:hypothetical protein